MNTKQLLKDLALVTIGTSALAFISLTPVLANANEASAFNQTVTAEISLEATQSDAVSKGNFEGRSKHVTSGQASIVKTATGYDLVLADNFFLDGAPSPVLGFGNNDAYDTSSTFSKLNKKEGGQTYTLPSGFTPGQYSQVFVWCEDFSVPLGVATLS